MKRIIASILAAGAMTFALAGAANAAEPCAPAQQEQLQRTSFESRYFRERQEHERFERLQARKRALARLRYERMHRFGYGRW